ncbi:type IV pilin N-terminal domain-containing protein [Methanoculleus palmolei]|uniref:Type IV pilin N-terminal domain-containing protein n=1 Tax=Methanoculleus palmolei TaxID=72612 RepID=A0ABD8AA90_9EURY|nr:type IV pilin N-terminal domain-containing protein [Methanoculleus palmolei]
MTNVRKKNDEAVSPVIGVMLMLVVTIIIAAVVSGFAGGLASTQEKAPAASFEARIANSGSWGTSTFDLLCLATDQPIPTKDLKLVTTWTRSNGTSLSTVVTGPSTVPNTAYSTYSYNSPLGFGPGVNQTAYSGNYYTDQHYGNYTLMAGTRLHNTAAGWGTSTGGYGVSPDTRYQYSTGSYGLGPGESGVDAMMAILGLDWYELRPGGVVNVKLIHVPSQKVIFDKDVVVEEG